MTAATAAEEEPPGPPVFRLRDQRSEYVGPGRDVPPATGVREVLIGYFGPDDPGDPIAGDMWRAAVLAVDEANRDGGYQGKPFRLVAAWAADPWAAGATVLARQVYQERVWAIVGGIDGPTTHLAEQVVAKARLPLVSPVATDKTANLANVPWLFSVAPGDHLIAPPLAAAIARQVDRRGLIVVSADDHDSRHLAVESLAALKAKQIVPKYRFTVRSGEDEYDEMAGRVVGADAGCVLVIGDARDSAAIVRALRAAGCTSRLFGGPAMGRHRFRELAGRDGDGVVFPQLYVPPEDAPDGFDYAAAHTYDAVRLLIAAIRRAGLNRAAIGDALRDLSPTRGITGPIRWDNLGSNTRPVPLNQ